jgi:hypothetical protein
MLKVRLHESIGVIEPARWNLAEGDPFSTHAVLSALESAGMEGVRMRYAQMEDGQGRILASVPFARLPMDGARLTHGLFRFGIRALRRIAPSFLRTSLMICGTPLSVGNPPLRTAPGSDPRPLLLHAAGLLRELADQEKAPWRVFKEFSAEQGEAAAPLRSAGWILAPSEPNCALPIRWGSFRSYLDDLRHPYRAKVIKSAAKSARAGVEVTLEPLCGGYDPSLHLLYEGVVERAQVQFERLTPRFFHSLGSALPGQAHLLRFRRAGRTIGWVALVLNGGRLHDLFHGIDYAENPAVDLYFNQLAETIRLAIDLGARRLSLGQSTLTAKSRFGCLIEPLWIALRHRDPAVNLLLRRGSRILFPPEKAPERRVFHMPGVPSEGVEACAFTSS